MVYNTISSNLEVMKNTVSINPDKLYTKSAYHKNTGMARSTIDQKIEENKIKSIKINGAVIIIKD